jgi:hypothetical protein
LNSQPRPGDRTWPAVVVIRYKISQSRKVQDLKKVTTSRAPSLRAVIEGTAAAALWMRVLVLHEPPALRAADVDDRGPRRGSCGTTRRQSFGRSRAGSVADCKLTTTAAAQATLESRLWVAGPAMICCCLRASGGETIPAQRYLLIRVCDIIHPGLGVGESSQLEILNGHIADRSEWSRFRTRHLGR